MLEQLCFFIIVTVIFNIGVLQHT